MPGPQPLLPNMANPPHPHPDPLCCVLAPPSFGIPRATLVTTLTKPDKTADLRAALPVTPERLGISPSALGSTSAAAWRTPCSPHCGLGKVKGVGGAGEGHTFGASGGRARPCLPVTVRAWSGEQDGVCPMMCTVSAGYVAPRGPRHQHRCWLSFVAKGPPGNFPCTLVAILSELLLRVQSKVVANASQIETIGAVLHLHVAGCLTITCLPVTVRACTWSGEQDGV